MEQSSLPSPTTCLIQVLVEEVGDESGTDKEESVDRVFALRHCLEGHSNLRIPLDLACELFVVDKQEREREGEAVSEHDPGHGERTDALKAIEPVGTDFLGRKNELHIL